MVYIVRELKDRKKIRFLLALGDAPQEEITYFRDRLDKRLVKISKHEVLFVNSSKNDMLKKRSF
jgi:hypothetical protein